MTQAQSRVRLRVVRLVRWLAGPTSVLVAGIAMMHAALSTKIAIVLVGGAASIVAALVETRMERKSATSKTADEAG